MKTFPYEEISSKTLRYALQVDGQVNVLIQEKSLASVKKNLDDIARCFGGLEMNTFSEKLSPYKLIPKFIFSFFTNGKIYDLLIMFIYEQPLYKVEGNIIKFFNSSKNEKNAS